MDKGVGKGGNKGGGNSRKKCSKDGGGGNSYRSNDNSNHCNGGVQMMGNKWMFFCKRKPCGWNTTHTYWFHVAWVKNNKTFTLPATHEFRIKTRTAVFDSSGSTQSDYSLRSVGGDSASTKLLVGIAKVLVNAESPPTDLSE